MSTQDQRRRQRPDQPLTPEFSAMLKNAAIKLAREKRYTPESEEALMGWMQENYHEIVTRAQRRMEKLTEWALDNMDNLAPIMGERVYNEINIRFGGETRDNVNPRYADWAASIGMTPGAARQAHATNALFLTWNGDPGIAHQVIRTRAEWEKIALECRGKTRPKGADTLAMRFAKQDLVAGILERSRKVTLYCASNTAKAGYRVKTLETPETALALIQDAYRDPEGFREGA